MDMSDEHLQAIKRSLVFRNEVSCEIFDDKVRRYGKINVSNGVITITLDNGVTNMATPADTRRFLFESILAGLDGCYTLRPETFDKTTF